MAVIIVGKSHWYSKHRPRTNSTHKEENAAVAKMARLRIEFKYRRRGWRYSGDGTLLFFSVALVYFSDLNRIS